MTVDLRELDADPKEIQQWKFVGQLKKLNADVNPESVFVLIISARIEETRLKLFEGTVTVL